MTACGRECLLLGLYMDAYGHCMFIQPSSLCSGGAQEFEEQPCFLCGGTGHRQYECPNKGGEVFKLPDAIQGQVDRQYQKDIARMGVRLVLPDVLC